MTIAAAPATGNVRPDGASDWLRFYDVDRFWSDRIEPHLADKKLNAILVRDFDKFTQGRWGLPFRPGDLPADYEPCDCRSRQHPPHPPYWDYVAIHACRWLVNFNLGLASLAEPSRLWRIIHGERHSSVWDGSYTLFDLNSLAFGVKPWECFSNAYGRELPPGRLLKVKYAGRHTKVDWMFTCRPRDPLPATASDAPPSPSSRVCRSA